MLYTPGEATFARDLLSLIEEYKKDLEQVLSRLCALDPNNDAGATFARYKKNLSHANISIHNLEKQLNARAQEETSSWNNPGEQS
jgi:ubiquinone biosynthesis protein UbiJ